MENIITAFIPILVFAIPLLAIWTKHQRQMAQNEPRGPQDTPETLAKIERLEQRVRVLERIITDKSSGLAHEIENLRNAPLN